MAEGLDENIKPISAEDDFGEEKSYNIKSGIALWRRADLILICFWIFFALGLFLFSIFNIKNAAENPKLEILIGNEIYGEYELSEDRTINIGDGNICEIKKGSVRMTYADCPDKTCLHSREISKAGESIVCLPNHVVLKITGGSDREIDTVAE